MMRLFLALVMTALFSSTVLQAQSEDSPDAFAFHYHVSNYQWPLKKVNSRLDDFKFGSIGFEYYRYLNNTFDLSFPIRVGTAAIPLSDSGSPTQRQGFIGFDAVLNCNLYKGRVFRPRLFAGIGGMLHNLDYMTLDVPLGLGLNFYLGANTYLSTNIAYHLSDTDRRDHLQAGIGLRMAINDFEKAPPPPPPVLDRDGDGVNDDVDQCPDTPGLASLQGCPDKDGDGTTDAKDNCPDEAGPAENSGCPYPDRDGDGVLDKDDNCPDVAGTVANKGCPEKSMIITAKDKISGEVLPNAEVAIKGSNGQVVKTGKTNNMGIVEFANVEPKDYNVDGKLYDIDLESAQIQMAEFNSDEAVRKTIFYDDPNFIIQGKVFVCNTPDPLPGVALNLKNTTENFMKSTTSDGNGLYIFHLSNRGSFELYAKKEDFLSQVVEVNASKYDRKKSLFVRLEVCAEEVECGEAIRLDNILYDLGSANIRPEAYPDLNKLVRFMEDNPSATVELSAHTDSRGGASTNMRLSQNRANSVAKYIVSQGIAQSRVTSRGYGETQLVNRCADGVRCSEAEHQANRRTEFKVICPK